MFRWYLTTTCRTRYVGDLKSERSKYDASSDIFESVTEHAHARQKKFLRILDVGCSRGVATAYMKGKLAERGIETSMGGVDIAPDVFEAARQNLDKFYAGDIETVNIKERHDVVLCSKMLKFAFPNEQQRLLAKFAELCVPDGVMIVDGVLKTMPGKYHTISKNEAAAYGLSLVQRWDSLTRWQRLDSRMMLCPKRHGEMAFYEAKRCMSRAWRRVKATVKGRV